MHIIVNVLRWEDNFRNLCFRSIKIVYMQFTGIMRTSYRLCSIVFTPNELGITTYSPAFSF